MRTQRCNYLSSTVFFAVLLFSVLNAAEQKRKTFALSSLAPSGIDSQEAADYSQHLREAINDVGLYSMLAPADLEQRLTDQDIRSYCVDVRGAIVAGQVAGVDYLAFGSIGKIGKAFAVSLQVVEVRSGSVVRDVSEFFKGKKSVFLSEVMLRVAAETCGVQLEGEKR